MNNLPPPAPPQLHPSSASCHRHPDEQFTGFCPSCLFERLTTLNPSSSTTTTNNNPSSSRRNSTSAATSAIKSLFSKPTKPTNFFPELRRSKSFTSKNDVVKFNFEPQRRSCDVRAQNSNFTQTQILNCEDLVNKPVLEPKGESEEEFEDCENNVESNVDEVSEIRVQQGRVSCSEIVEEEDEVDKVIDDYVTAKPIKDFLDLDMQSKKGSSGGVKEIAGGFLSAASVFSKKWHNWRRKQKGKKEKNGENSGGLAVEKGVSRKYRESRSEVADYGVGRRSCDVDTRFSLDAGRVSFDDPRCSFEQPRASWDGHLVTRSFPKMHPMDSLVEDAPVVHVPVVENEVLVEEQGKVNCVDEDENVPGGSAQTRDYYADSSTRRRKSLDRSSSIKKTAAAVVAEIDEMKAVLNAKVSPATVDNFNGAKDLVGEGVVKDSNSLSNDCSETFDLGSLRDNASVIGNEERKGTKKSRWKWKLWAFINKRSGWRKDNNGDAMYSRGVERSLSESCQRSNEDAELREGLNRKIFRSNSSVSWRNSPNFETAFGSVNRPAVETNGLGKTRRDEFVLERNRSGRYSPTNVDNNSLLRFYLTPMRGSRRVGPGKNRLSRITFV